MARYITLLDSVYLVSIAIPANESLLVPSI
jgi:hypothetical protein